MSLLRSIRRFSVYGDRLTRLMECWVRATPAWVEPAFVFFWSVVFYLLCARQRRAVVSNLRAIFPGWSFWRAQAGSFRVIWNFAWTMVDGVRASVGQDVILWEIDGREEFERLSASDGGAIILTAHMGNYDLAGPVFSDRFGRRLNAVRAPERNAELQEHYDKRREQQQSASFAVRYNRAGGMLGVELASLLQSGELVALQGDRLLFEVSATEGVMFGRKVRFPKGPFALALAGRCPLWPLFIIRRGWRHYCIRVGREFEVSNDRSNREGAMADALGLWCNELECVLSDSWFQWFVFEPVFEGEANGE
ncbi:MAG: lysophospholipid acyltransferase family protein [Verrucomicrobiaceae bacterium]|nr:lysophospholipid acyltransferase family protein [Verrucomicrobiaceae bacterium]